VLWCGPFHGYDSVSQSGCFNSNPEPPGHWSDGKRIARTFESWKQIAKPYAGKTRREDESAYEQEAKALRQSVVSYNKVAHNEQRRK